MEENLPRLIDKAILAVDSAAIRAAIDLAKNDCKTGYYIKRDLETCRDMLANMVLTENGFKKCY